MRAFILYRQQIDFHEPVRALTQILRLTPRGFDGQHVQDWHVGVEPDARLRKSEDAFGNIIHSGSHDGPLERVTIFAEGEIETSDTAGVVAGQYEKLPLDIYLRDVEGVRADAGLREFVRNALEGDSDPLSRMHSLMGALHRRCKFEPGETPAPRPAAEVFASGGGSARELAQVFVAAARAENIPARFVSGFFLGASEDARHSTGYGASGDARLSTGYGASEDARLSKGYGASGDARLSTGFGASEDARLSKNYDESAVGEAAAHHAWAEVFVEPIGWIGFDCALGYCPRGEHLRVAQGLDYYGAAPRRSATFGFAQEQAVTRLSVSFGRQAGRQVQQ